MSSTIYEPFSILNNKINGKFISILKYKFNKFVKTQNKIKGLFKKKFGR
jgi:hypothetical protein